MKKEITVEVQEVPEKTLYLTQHLGDGTLGETKFDASFTLPDMSLLVTVGKKKYKVSSQHIIEGIIRAHESDQKKQ